MTAQTLTLLFVGLVTLVAIPAYDVWAFVNDETGDTISNVLASLKAYIPILPYLWGIAGGHLFATAPPLLHPGARAVWLVWSSAVIMLLCYAQVLDVNRRADVIGMLVVGAVVGALLLSQRHTYTLPF